MPVDVLQRTLIFSLQVTVQRMEAIQLRFKLQSELHFFFVRPQAPVDLLLQLNSQLNFFLKTLVEVAFLSFRVVESQFELFFLLSPLIDLPFEISFHLVNPVLVLGANLSNHHLVVGLAAVLEEDRVDLPDV